jgi:hypothetical protein
LIELQWNVEEEPNETEDETGTDADKSIHLSVRISPPLEPNPDLEDEEEVDIMDTQSGEEQAEPMDVESAKASQVKILDVGGLAVPPNFEQV